MTAFRDTLDRVAGVVCSVTGADAGDLPGRSRRTEAVYARMLFARFASERGVPVRAITEFLRRDRVTVRYHYLAAYGERCAYDSTFRVLAMEAGRLLDDTGEREGGAA